MIIQLCGLSGAGKTTIAQKVKQLLAERGIITEVIDGDEYRKELCADLGFSKAHRNENIRRLAFVANKLSQYNVFSIICAINPYEDVRKEIAAKYGNVKTVYINCDMTSLEKRDTKGLYKRAHLPEGDPDRVNNLTGVNDPFEIPVSADLVINTNSEPADDSAKKVYNFIISHLK